MDPLLVYYTLASLGFLSASISTLRFFQIRTKGASAEDRSEFTPILIVSLSFLAGFLTSLLNVISAESPSPGLLLVGDLANPLFGFGMLASVLTMLRRPRFIVIGLIFLAASWFVSLTSALPLEEPARSVWVIAGNSLLVLPLLLFGYLFATTKRSTAFGLTIGIALYLAYHDIMTLNPIQQGFIAVLFLTLGFAFTSFSFLYYDRRLGGEIVGYVSSITLVLGAAMALLVSSTTIPTVTLVSLFLAVCSGAASLLTGSYLYGRYRESPFRQTIALSLFMLFSGFSWIMTAIYNADLDAKVFGLTSTFLIATLVVGLIAVGFLFLSAALSLGSGKLAVIPVVLIVLTATLGYLVGANDLWILVVLLDYCFMAFVPIAMFAVLWRRIRIAKEKDAGKPLGIFVGLILISISTLISLVPSLVTTLTLVGVLIIFLGVSSRIDKWFYSQSPKK